MTQLTRQIKNRMTMTADVLIHLGCSLLAVASRYFTGERVLLIPVDSKRRRAGAIPVRMSSDLRRSPSVRPWPLCRIDRD